MTSVERGLFERAAGASTVTANETGQMTRGLNRLLALPDLSDAAEVLAAIGWGIVALLSYRSTGLPPTPYQIFTG
jgi:hypothetical protein